MGRELQKHKNRSSISKVRRKPKSKKRLLQHAIIAANWDKTQTLSQNYRRLGLTAKLNKETGGVEKTVEDVEREREVDLQNGGDGGRRGGGMTIAASRKRAERLDVREAKIERDAKTGAIVKVVDDGLKKRKNPLNDRLNDLDSSEEDEAEDSYDQHGSATHLRQQTLQQPKTAVVSELEQEANRPVRKYKRKQPQGERAFVEELVQKYGDDYAAMARDIKINYMQRSEGDLKRRIKKWREAGGTVAREAEGMAGT